MRRSLNMAAGVGLLLAAWPLLSFPAGAAWGAILASWLFVTGAALGCVVLSATCRVVYARWSESLVSRCETAVGLLPWSFGVLLAISAAGPFWLPWVGHAAPERQWWLNVPFFEIRQVVLALLLFGLARLHVRTPARAPEARGRAVAFLIAFAVVTTLWTVDFVMALDPVWVDPMLGGFYFMGSFLGGVATAILYGADESGDLRHDVGKLFFGLAVFWGYLLFVQTLVIWYGNQTDETAFVLARLASPWRQIGFASVLLVFLAPFTLLMREAAKRKARLLRAGAAGVLAGLWLEMQLLVLPSLTPHPTLPVLSAGLGCLLFLGSRLLVALQAEPASAMETAAPAAAV